MVDGAAWAVAITTRLDPAPGALAPTRPLAPVRARDLIQPRVDVEIQGVQQNRDNVSWAVLYGRSGSAEAGA